MATDARCAGRTLAALSAQGSTPKQPLLAASQPQELIHEPSLTLTLLRQLVTGTPHEAWV